MTKRKNLKCPQCINGTVCYNPSAGRSQHWDSWRRSRHERHQRYLKLQGKAQKTIDAYSRAIRRARDYFDCCPDKLKPEQLEKYFADLVGSHSWSTVRIDRLGLQFLWKYVLKLEWKWIDIVKPPKVKTIPDIVTPAEVDKLIATTRKLHYPIFLNFGKKQPKKGKIQVF